ncbi:MAG: serine/threonine protein kinase [Armatimonadota bacterium]
MSLGKIGKYEKLDVLGHGASGIVYLAWDTFLGKHVALKDISIPASEEGRFLEEARVLDRLRHPNIVQVNSVDRVDGHLIIDMEYVKGTNLLEHMRKHGCMDIRNALNIVIQICDALDFAHRNHTIHRDVKPANILISNDGAVKIVDFGLAEILGSGSYAGGAGTYAYMAPEDFEEEQKSDHRSDIWAVGVTLYEVLTGTRPFLPAKAKDPFSWKRTVDEDEPESICKINSSFPLQLEQVISKALAKDKYDRYQTAGEMRDDLSRILKSIGGTVPRLGVSEAASPGTGVQTRVKPVPEKVNAAVSDAVINPTSVDFGEVKRGESSNRKFTVSVPGRGRCAGRIVSQPGWLDVTPEVFSRRNQVFTLNADTERIWEPGRYDESLVLEIDGRSAKVPVSVDVMPPRKRFYQVAWWYIPLFMMCLLPMVVHNGGWLGRNSSIGSADMVTIGLLSVMMFIIGTSAELGSLERLVPALFAAIGLGTVIGAIWQSMFTGVQLSAQDTSATAVSGALLSFTVVIQLLTAANWKVWAGILVAISICATFLLAI